MLVDPLDMAKAVMTEGAKKEGCQRNRLITEESWGNAMST